MRDASTPLVIAHRGASGHRPEHTRAAYQVAIELGARAIEPDIVPTRDGVLVLRHENEISGTTDVADRPEFADRRTTKEFLGQRLTGWFTEDFTWAELQTLRARERLPQLRPGSAAFDGTEPLLRLEDLLSMLEAAPRELTLVAELKHASYFESIGLPLHELVPDALARWAGRDRLVVESFEQTVLGQVRARGLEAEYVFLAEAEGAPADLLLRDGASARSYADHLTDEGLARLAAEVDGVSPSKVLLLDGAGTTDLIARAKAAGLRTYTWTLRPENSFLAEAHRRGDDPAAYGDWRTEFGLILATGVDGVFADHPELMLELLGEGGAVGGRA